jgi:hypothetical protein
MSIFRHQQPASRMTLNPADGQAYEAVHLPNRSYGQHFSVFWTGKTLDYDATNAGHRDGKPGPVIFTDGSWADSATGEFGNAGPGELAVSAIAGDGKPW